MEIEAKALQHAAQCDDAATTSFSAALQGLEGRFLFLGGIYQAHSVSEDEVVFPALEKKHHTLKNVSTSYTLDHEQEIHLFAELGSIIRDIQRLVLLSFKLSATGCNWHAASIARESRSSEARMQLVVDKRLQTRLLSAALSACLVSYAWLCRLKTELVSKLVCKHDSGWHSSL
jgi:hypothetical protein